MTAAVAIQQPAHESVLKPAALLMCGRTLAFLATFFIPVVLVRVFDQAQFGTYKQLFLIQSSVFLLAQFGMASSLYYFLPRAPLDGGRYVANALLFLGAVGATAMVMLSAAASHVAAWMNNPAMAAFIPWIGAYCLLMMLAASLEMVLISKHRYAVAAASYALSDLARAAAFMIPALLTGQLIWLLKAAVLVAGLRAAAAVIYFNRAFPGSFVFDKELFKSQLAYSVPFGLAVFVEICQANLPAYFVSYFTTPANFAIFAVGCLQIPLVDFAASPTSDVMMVHMQERLVQGRKDAVLAIWHDTTWKLALLFVPLVALLIVSAHDLITLLFTSKYQAAIPIFVAWTTLILLTTLQVDGFLRVFAETRTILVLNIARLVIIATLIKLSMASLHLLGPALVVVLATAVFKLGALVRIRAILEIGTVDLLPWRKLAVLLCVTAAAAAAAVLVRLGLSATPFVRLLAMGALFSASYVVLVWNFNLLTRAEKSSLAATLARPMRAWRS